MRATRSRSRSNSGLLVGDLVGGKQSKEMMKKTMKSMRKEITQEAEPSQQGVCSNAADVGGEWRCDARSSLLALRLGALMSETVKYVVRRR